MKKRKRVFKNPVSQKVFKMRRSYESGLLGWWLLCCWKNVRKSYLPLIMIGHYLENVPYQGTTFLKRLAIITYPLSFFRIRNEELLFILYKLESFSLRRSVLCDPDSPETRKFCCFLNYLLPHSFFLVKTLFVLTYFLVPVLYFSLYTHHFATCCVLWQRWASAMWVEKGMRKGLSRQFEPVLQDFQRNSD